jgi:hypothetical protein
MEIKMNTLSLNLTKNSSNLSLNSVVTTESNAFNLSKGYNQLFKGYDSLSKSDKKAIRKACQGVEIQAVDIVSKIGELNSESLLKNLDKVQAIKTTNSKLVICKNNGLTFAINVLDSDVTKFDKVANKK